MKKSVCIAPHLGHPVPGSYLTTPEDTSTGGVPTTDSNEESTSEPALQIVRSQSGGYTVADRLDRALEERVFSGVLTPGEASML